MRGQAGPPLQGDVATWGVGLPDFIAAGQQLADEPYLADVARLENGSVGPNRIGLFSAHVNGTCRMGTDPSTSGATPEGERHGVRGLYISDGSLLPTSLGVNPQETIMAIATVLAERMAMRHAGVTRN